MEPLYKKSWFKVITGLLVLCLLFISFLPFAVRYALERWYLQQDVDSTSIEDIDINLFSGEFKIKNLRALRGQKEVLSLKEASFDFDWLPLFEKRSFFPLLHVKGLSGTLRQDSDGQLVVGGIKLGQEQTKQKESPSNWDFGLHDIAIEDAHLDIRTPLQSAKLHFDHIKLRDLHSWSQEVSDIDLAGHVNQAGLSLRGKLRLFGKQPGFTGQLKVTKLDLRDVAHHMQQHIQELSGILDLESDIKLELLEQQTLNIATQSTLSLSSLQGKLNTHSMTLDKLIWRGKNQVHLPRATEGMSFRIEGSLKSENVDFDVPTQDISYHHDNFDWHGLIDKAAAKNIQLKGDINASGIKLMRPSIQQGLLQTGKLAIQALDFEPNTKLETQQIIFEDIRSLFSGALEGKKQKPTIIQAKQLKIASSTYNRQDHALSIGKLSVMDALVYLHKQRTGGFEQISSLGDTKKTKRTPAPQAAAVQEATKPFQLLLEEVNIHGNSKLNFVDSSVSPRYKTELNIKQAQIRRIDNSKPNAASPFIIEARKGKYSSILLQGKAYPFSKPLSLELDAQLKNISLPALSSYSANIIGYDLRSGQLHATLKSTIKKGKIDAKNQITLSNLEVRSSAGKKSQDFTAQLSMPLDSALSLLRDKNNNIKLEIPVKGDINKPDFDISGVINKAISTAMQKASLAYLSHALQPYGSLITLAKLAKAASEHVSLNPINFTPASALTDDNAREYSNKIAALMQERPKLRIKLCGMATQQDRQALIAQQQQAWQQQQTKIQQNQNNKPAPPVFMVDDEQLLALANKRADAIKDILVNEHGIDPARLFLCQPAIDKDAEAVPRIDLNI